MNTPNSNIAKGIAPNSSAANVPWPVRWLVISGAIALFIAAFFLFTANVPWADDYDAILKYAAIPDGERWKHVLDLHNEHRIATTRLVAELLQALTGHVNLQACTAIGNVFMIILATIWYRKFKSIGHEWTGLAMFAALLSLVHWSNQLNALCSNSNVNAILLPFLALLLEREQGWKFACAMLIAAAATFTSGSGVFVWPALIVVEWMGRRDKKRMAAILMLAVIIAGAYFMLPNDHAPTVVHDVAKPGETVLAKTTIMGYTVELTPMFIVRHVGYAANYFLACVGGIVIVPWLNVALGAVMCAILAWQAITYRKIKCPAVFGLALCLLGACASCGVFRAGSFNAYLPSRYQIVCVSLFACVAYLVLERQQDSPRTRRWEAALCAVACIASISWFIYDAPTLRTRAENMRRNILMWPASNMGLAYPEDRLPHASHILGEACRAKVYVPSDLAKDGEVAPTDALPMPIPEY